jgi:hypothetical protein
MKRTHDCTITLLFILFTVPLLSQAEVLITPDNAQINYYGRFDFSNPSAPRFNWSGSIIEAAFSGNSIGINLKDGQADYDIEIDGKIDTIIRTESNTSKYDISSKLSTGNHVIRIMQRSENHWGVAIFGGFYLADGNQLLAAPQKPVRKIEFIGDSHTVGYGNESSSRTCSSTQLRSYTNTNRSFGPIVGKAFHSQYTVLGWSGRGMVRNFGDAAKKSSDPYPNSYGSTLGTISGNWDFTKWIPDLVVISLCTNDFSTTPYPDDTMFINGYHKFISSVLSHYSNTSILCVSSHAGRADTCIKSIVSEENSMGHNKIYYAEYPQNLTANGCDWHPTVADDKLIADTLISVIMRKIGWDTLNQTTNAQNHNYTCKKSPFTIKPVDSWNGNFQIEGLSNDRSVDLEITDIKGRLVSKLITNQNHIVEWNTSGLRSGIYLIGNSYYGWKRAVVKRS